jgi:hypothetical protein
MNLISKFAQAIAFLCKGFRLEQFFAALLLFSVFLTTNLDSPRYAASTSQQYDQPLGERILERIEQADRESDRPKTTGEFLEEARGDVPLDERLENIKRDSVEAFKQAGQDYSIAAEEITQELKNKVIPETNTSSK